MNLAFALFTYFPFGGLTRDMLTVARACQARGHRVRVYAGEIRGPVEDDLDLQTVPSNALTNPGKNRKFAAQLPQAVADFSPHLIIGFNKMPGLDIYYAADDCFAAKRARRGRLYRMTPRCRQSIAFERAVFGNQSRADIMLIAPKQGAVFRSFYGTPESRMTLLPPGISRSRIAGDDAPARRRAFRRQWRLNDDDIQLLAVGSGYQTKGVDRTLAAFASLPAAMRARAHLFIVGGGKSKRYQKQSRRARIHSRVRFTGGRDDVAEFMLAADVLLHPARQEAGGIVLLEALVAGLPVIATDVCGYAPYIVDAGMGCVLGAPFEQAALDHALLELIERHDTDRDLWRARGRDFANTADIYDMPAHACAFIEAVGENTRHSGR